MTNRKIERLNLILRTIRKVNRLLVKEKVRANLLQGICDNLTENRGYYNVWIVHLDGSGQLLGAAESGLGRDFDPLVAQMKHGDWTDCCQVALARSEAVLIEDPLLACGDCPLARKYKNRSGVAVRLKHNEKIFGLLCVSIPREFLSDKDELDLLKEIAGDIAFGLHNIETEDSRIETKENLAQTVRDLKKRMKELNCLYQVSKIIEEQNASLEMILQSVTEEVPLSFQYPETCCARITLDDQQYKSENFAETEWVLTRGITVNSELIGLLEVFYLSEKPDQDEGAFQNDERNLVNAIAERLGRVVERKITRKALLESEKGLRDLVENSLTGISIIQGDKILYRNPKQKVLLAGLPHLFHNQNTGHIYPEDVDKVESYYKELLSNSIKTDSIDFRFYPPGKIGSKPDMKWVHCLARQIDFKGERATLINLMDITTPKELEMLLAAQDKMASLGRVAAGIAHEIRNPLSGINIYLSALEKSHETGEYQKNFKQIIEQLQSASCRIESVIKRVMDFSKTSEPSFVQIDINRPVKEAIDLSSVTLRKSGVAIEHLLSDELATCNADPQLISQVVLNLITNAAEAMKNLERGKQIKVVTNMDNGQVTVSVSDSGPGVPLRFREKVFEPFYTTKDWSTGIGLSLCHRLISDHRGSIKIHESELGGAEFRISIPVTTSEGNSK